MRIECPARAGELGSKMTGKVTMLDIGCGRKKVLITPQLVVRESTQRHVGVGCRTRVSDPRVVMGRTGS
jgi:hypothetical protein